MLKFADWSGLFVTRDIDRWEVGRADLALDNRSHVLRQVPSWVLFDPTGYVANAGFSKVDEL